jgi:hypothetical protein
MRATRLRYCVLLLLGLAPIMLNACAPGSSDPPVGLITPDTTYPSTLKVTVSINDDQDASDGKSVITLTFNTNEILEDNNVIFTNGETIDCNGTIVHLGNAVNYLVRVSVSSMYSCNYILHGRSFLIIAVHKRSRLSPVLHKPVSNPFKVSYHPDSIKLSCPLQVVANDAASNVPGPIVQSDGNIYTGTGTDVSTLNGAGNIMMTRTCHWNLSDGNLGDSHADFDTVNITYLSTASYEVSWVSSGSPTQSTSS